MARRLCTQMSVPCWLRSAQERGTYQYPCANGARLLHADTVRLLEDPALVDEKSLLERRVRVQPDGHAAVDIVADAELGAIRGGGNNNAGGVTAQDGGVGFDEQAGVVHERLAGSVSTWFGGAVGGQGLHGIDAGVETLDESLFGAEGGDGDVVCDEVGGVGGRDGDSGLGGHGCGSWWGEGAATVDKVNGQGSTK